LGDAVVQHLIRGVTFQFKFKEDRGA
jgi:hypothetical protein